MNALPAYITSELRFPAEEILCKGNSLQLGCAAADGEAAYAIHTFQGKHYCAYHSPFANTYVPCGECGEKPALASTENHPVCDDCRKAAAGRTCAEDAERAAYVRYVSNGLADTDGYFAPEPFETWQAHHHRAIGLRAPRTAECTDTQCNAPSPERTRRLNFGTPRKPKYQTLCPSCYGSRVAAVVAADRARRSSWRVSA